MKYIDWEQVALNFRHGGPPCFAVLPEAPDRYCCRAERWEGHGSDHDYVSIEHLFSEAPLYKQGYDAGYCNGLAAKSAEIKTVLDAVEADVESVLVAYGEKGKDWPMIRWQDAAYDNYKAAIAAIRERLQGGKDGDKPSQPIFEYEYFFESEPDEVIPIDGWVPVATERFKRPVDELIRAGKVRRLSPPQQGDKEN